MLRELYIKNFALIEDLTLRFDGNLNILSGETGTGKSIIVGALGLVLGDKARTTLIRTGADQCVVEGRFSIDGEHPVHRLLEERGVALEGGEDVIIRRVITTAGTSRSYINGQQVGVRDLGSVTDQLVDIHGQHEHQSLLNVKNHLHLLDHYGRLHREVASFKESFGRVKAIDEEIDRLAMDEREKERRMDMLQYALREIDQADLKDEKEDDLLEEQYRVLKNYERLATSVDRAYGLLRRDEASTVSLLEEALQAIEGIRSVSGDIDAIIGELESARNVIDESAHTLQGFVDGIDYEPGKIDRVLARMELLKNLKKKYGATIRDVLAYREEAAEELSGLETNEERIRALQEERSRMLGTAQARAIELSAQRRVAARTLSEKVMEELQYLHLSKSRFTVHVSYRKSEEGTVLIDGKRYELLSTGLDQIEFLITTNVGEPLMPLRNVASGGELSRIMLAIKTVLGNVDPIQTFVFDEIDAGIGGKTAWAVGMRLRDMARFKQILCITHQAQIASRGSLNMVVRKLSRNGRTVTEVATLEGDDKIREIARMISGERISDAAIRQAVEMIEEKA
jgi:DNA repair protein RecN (Recombination protein N)